MEWKTYDEKNMSLQPPIYTCYLETKRASSLEHETTTTTYQSARNFAGIQQRKGYHGARIASFHRELPQSCHELSTTITRLFTQIFFVDFHTQLFSRYGKFCSCRRRFLLVVVGIQPRRVDLVSVHGEQVVQVEGALFASVRVHHHNVGSQRFSCDRDLAILIEGSIFIWSIALVVVGRRRRRAFTRRCSNKVHALAVIGSSGILSSSSHHDMQKGRSSSLV